jgi:SAM-dependent methyltransferase
MTDATQTPARETVACPLCGSAATSMLFAREDHYPPHESFKIVRCGSCELLRVDPRPPAAAIGAYYSDTYSWKAEEPVQGFVPNLIRQAEHWYRFHLLRYEARKVQRRLNPGPGAEVLDVGCGSGDRLIVYRDLGLEPYGVEIGAAGDYARSQLGLRVRRGTLEDAAYDNEQFDIVTLYNVLEHVHAPCHLLDEIHRILRPSGGLVIEVPNTECLQFKLFGQRWAALDVPRDLFYWNARLLRHMLEKHGYDVAKVDYWTSWLHPPMIVLTLFPSLDPRLAWAAQAQGGGSSLVKRCLWALLTLTLWPVTLLESLLGRGSSMVFYARKK